MTSPSSLAAPLAPGDLIFFAGNPLNPVDDAIMIRTGGKWVHVEIVVATPSDASPRTIGALASGITPHDLPAHGIPAMTAAHCSPARLPGTLTWLRGQVGQPYSWCDIADQGISLIAPSAPLLTDGRYDCSHLAAMFLTRAGYPLPATLLARPQLISPVALAHAVGLSSDRARPPLLIVPSPGKDPDCVPLPGMTSRPDASMRSTPTPAHPLSDCVLSLPPPSPRTG